MSPPRCSAYVKANNARFGLKVASRDPSTGTVIGLQCRFCIAFGREEKVGSKRKPASTIQGWNAPFRYDNIEKHLCVVHPSQWDVYNAIKSADRRDSFFADGEQKAQQYKKSIKAHFPSEVLGAERQKVFDIEKAIVEKIVGEMMFNPEDDMDTDDEEEDHGNDAGEFGSSSELRALRRQRAVDVATAHQRGLSIFKKATSSSPDEDDEDDDDYSYTVTIPQTKTTVFNLAVRYVSQGTSFRMASNVIGCTYDVLGNPALRSCSRQDVSKFIRAVCCAVNLQRIAHHLRNAWGFSIALDSATHQSTSYLDFRFRILVKECSDIINLHGCALPMFDRHTGKQQHIWS
jgi:hypothetical protein